MKNLQAEKSVIASIMQTGLHAYRQAAGLLKGYTVFTDTGCRALWQAYNIMASSGMMSDDAPLSTPEVISVLQSTPASEIGGPEEETLFQAVEGFGGIIERAQQYSGRRYIERESRLVAEAWRRRQLVRAISSAEHDMKNPTKSPDDVLASLIEESRDIGSSQVRAVTGQDCIEQHNAREGALEALGGTLGSWGVPKLDSLMPLHPGGYYFIAARPGSGKTSMGLQVAQATAAKGVKTTFISLELPEADIGRKLLAAGDPIYEELSIVSATDANRAELRRICMSSVQAGAQVILVDYVQDVARTGAETEYERVTETSRMLRAIAKAESICMIGLAQLNRQSGTGEKIRPPRASDLRGSGNLEQDAFCILMLHLEDKESLVPDMQLILEKNRFGRTGYISAQFDKPRGRICEKAEAQPSRDHDRYSRAPDAGEDLFG